MDVSLQSHVGHCEDAQTYHWDVGGGGVAAPLLPCTMVCGARETGVSSRVRFLHGDRTQHIVPRLRDCFLRSDFLQDDRKSQRCRRKLD